MYLHALSFLPQIVRFIAYTSTISIQASLLLVSTPHSHVASNHFATRPQATITAAIVAASKA